MGAIYYFYNVISELNTTRLMVVFSILHIEIETSGALLGVSFISEFFSEYFLVSMCLEVTYS